MAGEDAPFAWQIIPVDARTLPDAAAVHACSWRASHRAFCGEAFVALHTRERQQAYLAAEMEKGKRLFLLLASGAPVGVVSVWGDLIENLYVLPGEQRKGYGARLLLFAMAQCAGAPRLWVLDNNCAALALYKKHGFAPTGGAHRLNDTLSEVEMLRAERAE